MKRASLKPLLAAGAVALASGLGSAAIASPYVGTISTAGGNDALSALFGVAEVEGLFGADLWLTGTSDIQVDYFGKEAGYKNTFDFGNDGVDFTTGSPQSEWGSLGSPDNPLASATYTSVSAGLLNFWFGADQNTASVSNGANPATGSSPNFFVSFGATPDTNINSSTAGGGKVVWLFFDDSGANPNEDNHDDMVIRLTALSGNFSIAPVPVPAGGLLLLGGLAGLAALRRRKHA